MMLYQITELKQFMGKLLTTECFDAFLLEQAVITTYNTFTIDGHQQREFYTAEEWEEPSIRPYSFSCWREIRPICFSLIKGRKTPASMKFILQAKPEWQERLLASSENPIPPHYVNSLVLTIRYQEGHMSCTTGVSYASFLPDKTPEQLWDRAFGQFLEQNGIV